MRNARLQRYAREMRRQPSDAERRLWYFLRRKNLLGFRFRRQVPFGPYILDFFCSDASLAIEIDGGQHADQHAYDSARSRYLRDKGIRVVRFWNNEVLRNTSGVLEVIVEELKTTSFEKMPPP